MSRQKLGYETASNDIWTLLDLYPAYRKFKVTHALCTSARLKASGQVISVSKGVSLRFQIEAGIQNKNRPYILLGSLAWNHPGTTLPGGITLPLNWDMFTCLVVSNLNTQPFKNFLGTLDDRGRASAVFSARPFALEPVMFGTLNFAYILCSPIDYASDPIPVQIVE